MELLLRGVSKSYGAHEALRDFTADWGVGIHALLGPNGAGKSTLMNIITGNLTADAGDIRCGDAETSESIFRMGRRFCAKLGYMPQYPGMYPQFTVEGFLSYMATLKEMGKGMRGRARRGYIEEAVTELLRAVELEDVRRRRISTLSGGMKQRLGLAQAVLGEPDVLILDEPTAGLDPKQRIAVRNFISRIALDKIVIIATHVVSDIESMARDVVFLKKGVIADNAPPDRLIRRIEGKVWLLPCREAEIETVQRKWRVINIAKREGEDNLLLRVLAEARPDAHAVAARPDLEDYYLYIFGDVSPP